MIIRLPISLNWASDKATKETKAIFIIGTQDTVSRSDRDTGQKVDDIREAGYALGLLIGNKTCTAFKQALLEGLISRH